MQIELLPLHPARQARAVAVAPAAAGGDAIALVTFGIANEALTNVLPPALVAQGTVAFRVPSGEADTCSLIGLATVDLLDLLSF